MKIKAKVLSTNTLNNGQFVDEKSLSAAIGRYTAKNATFNGNLGFLYFNDSRLQNCCGEITKLKFEDGCLVMYADTLNTNKGKKLESLMASGLNLCVGANGIFRDDNVNNVSIAYTEEIDSFVVKNMECFREGWNVVPVDDADDDPLVFDVPTNVNENTVDEEVGGPETDRLAYWYFLDSHDIELISRCMDNVLESTSKKDLMMMDKDEYFANVLDAYRQMKETEN